MTQNHETIKAGLDIFSISTLVGTLVGWLPDIASFLTVLWCLIRLYETQTVKDWLFKRKKK